MQRVLGIRRSWNKAHVGYVGACSPVVQIFRDSDWIAVWALEM